LRQKADLVQITEWACQFEAGGWRRVALTDGAEGRYGNSASVITSMILGIRLGFVLDSRAIGASGTYLSTTVAFLSDF